MMAGQNPESHPGRPRPMNTAKCPGPASHQSFHPMILSFGVTLVPSLPRQDYRRFLHFWLFLPG